MPQIILLIAELLRGIFYSPLTLFDNLLRGIYHWHIVGSFCFTGTATSPQTQSFPHIVARFSSHFSVISFALTIKCAPKTPESVAFLLPLLWSGAASSRHTIYRKWWIFHIRELRQWNYFTVSRLFLKWMRCMAEAALQECLRHSARTETTCLFCARKDFFKQARLFELFFASNQIQFNLRGETRDDDFE